MKVIKQHLAKHVAKHHHSDVFSIEIVLRESGPQVRRTVCNIFQQWLKVGATVIVGEYKRESGGAPHKLFKVKDINILVPPIITREKKLSDYATNRKLARQKAVDDKNIGLQIQSYALGKGFTLAHMPKKVRRYIGDMNA